MTSSPPKLFIHALDPDQLSDALQSDQSQRLGTTTLRSLSKRAILLSHPTDTIIVDSPPDPAWLPFLSTIGIETGTILAPQSTKSTLSQSILSDQHLLERLSKNQWMIEPYMGSQEIQHLSSTLNTELNAPNPKLLNQLNLKSNLHAFLVQADLPTIQTTTAPRDEIHTKAFQSFNDLGPLMVRADLSIGGLGVWKIESQSDIQALQYSISQSPAHRLFIIQPLLDIISSPNVQYTITDAKPIFLGISDQHMTPSLAFGGNDYPSPHAQHPDLLLQSQRITHWLHKKGYRGIVGIDFVITTENKAYIVEINPRVNTSTFPLHLAQRLGRSAFRLMTGLQTQTVTDFDQLVDGVGTDLLYDPLRGSGMIPLTVPNATTPTLDAMIFADDHTTITKLSNQLNNRLGLSAASLLT